MIVSLVLFVFVAVSLLLLLVAPDQSICNKGVAFDPVFGASGGVSCGGVSILPSFLPLSDDDE